MGEHAACKKGLGSVDVSGEWERAKAVCFGARSGTLRTHGVFQAIFKSSSLKRQNGDGCIIFQSIFLYQTSKM